MLLRDHLLKSRHGVPNWHPFRKPVRQNRKYTSARGSGVYSRLIFPYPMRRWVLCEFMQRFIRYRLSVVRLCFVPAGSKALQFCGNRPELRQVFLVPLLKKKSKGGNKHGHKTKNKTATLCNGRIILDGCDRRSSNLPTCLRPKTNHY